MSAKSPLGKIKDVADLAVVSVVSTVSGTVKDPVGTGQKVVGQALGVAGAVASRVPGLKKSGPERPEPVPQDEPEVAPVVPLQDKATKATPRKAAAKKAPAKKAPSAKAATGAPAKKAAPKKAAAKKPAVPAEPPATVEPAYTSESGDSSVAGPPDPDGAEPLLDPATAKAVQSETDVLRRGADRDPED